MTTDLVGLHATDPATPYLSLWARLPGFTVEDLDAELYKRRSLVKHLAMRRTLWVRLSMRILLPMESWIEMLAVRSISHGR